MTLRRLASAMAVIGILAVAYILVTTLSGCTSGCQSFNKGLQANTAGGLSRSIGVYSYDGKLLRSYKGLINIEETDSAHVMFLIEGRRRVSISNAIVINEEN